MRISLKINFKVLYHFTIPIFFFFTGELSLCSELDTVNTALSNLTNAINDAKLTGSDDLQNSLADVERRVTPLASSFKDQLEKCREVKSETDSGCFEGNNKSWNQFTGMMGTLTDVGSMTMSGSCSKFADALKLGQAAQVAIRGTCAFRKSDCVEKCELALKTFGRIKTVFESASLQIRNTEAPTSPTLAPTTVGSTTALQFDCGDESIKQELNKRQQRGDQITEAQLKAECKLKGEGSAQVAATTAETAKNKFKSSVRIYDGIAPTFEVSSDPDSPRSLKAACERTAQEVQSKVGMNLSNLMMTMQKNTACAKDFANLDTGLNLADCNLTGTCTTTPTPNECQDPQFKDSIYCKTPTTTSLDSRGSGGGMASTKPTTPDFNLNTGNLKGLNMDGLGGGGADGPGGPGSIPDTPGPKSAGVPGGSGGGGLSIPGAGGAAPNKGGGSRGVSSDGTNYGASPGYAGGTASIGGGSGDKNKDDLQQYLPGGAKDPNLAKAGGPEGITAAGGPTIFEKVTRGYKNSRSTLIPE